MIDKEAYREWQRTHPNIMTPTIKRLDTFNDRLIELSSGTGIEGGRIFGVTLIGRKDDGFVSLGGRMFYHPKSAENFANEIKAKRMKEVVE